MLESVKFILSHIQTLSDVLSADEFWKHCGKKSNFSLLPQYFQLFSIIKLSYRYILHFCWDDFKDVCCKFVVCGKGLMKNWQLPVSWNKYKQSTCKAYVNILFHFCFLSTMGSWPYWSLYVFPVFSFSLQCMQSLTCLPTLQIQSWVSRFEGRNPTIVREKLTIFENSKI